MGDWRKRLIIERQPCDPSKPHGCGARTGDYCTTKDGGRARQPASVPGTGRGGRRTVTAEGGRRLKEDDDG